MIKRYISDHWNGHFSLVKSFWVNGLLVGILSYAIFVQILPSLITIGYLSLAPDPVQQSVLLYVNIIAGVLSYSLSVVVSVWQLVGMWRSATNHPLNGGQIFWAKAVKGLIIFIITIKIIDFVRAALLILKTSVH
jgi:hypothetical protein